MKHAKSKAPRTGVSSTVAKRAQPKRSPANYAYPLRRLEPWQAFWHG